MYAENIYYNKLFNANIKLPVLEFGYPLTNSRVWMSHKLKGPDVT